MVGIIAIGKPASARQIPDLPINPQQIQQMLRDSTQAGIILDRIRASGLSPDEIRAQLRAAGLPSGILDAYLLQADSLGAPAPSTDIIDAMQVLGIGDFAPEDSLILAGDTVALRIHRDSVRLDSILALEREPKELQLFGLDVFRQPTTLFQPPPSAAVSGSYVLGTGDELVLFLTGDVERANQLTVTGTGFVVVPSVGRIPVAGLSMDQTRALLRSRLANSFSGIRTGTTQFDISVARVRMISVRVAGEVYRPGTYTMAATASPLSAIYEAAGLTELANFRNITIRRGTELVGRYDLYDYLLTGTVTTEVALQSGDVVFVPIAGPRVKLAGEVKRPAVYEMLAGETIADLINMAGGLTATAHMGNATIARILPPAQRTAPGVDRTVVTVSLQDVLTDPSRTTQLLDGDSLTIFRISNRSQRAVSIAGSVWQPGSYQLTPNMRLWELIQAAGGLKPETFTGRIQIRRMRPDSTRYMVGVVFPSDGSPPLDNPPLLELDEVTLFSKTDFRPDRTVSIFGEVHAPGEFEFADSLTLRDVVLFAGGITDEGYLLYAEVSRVLKDPVGGGDSLATTFRVDLDSTYVFDPTAYVRRPVGANVATDFVLEPFDQVFIRRQRGLERPQNVVVTGEVAFPGHYTLTSKDTRLSELLDLAGGLTPQAYANGIRYFRAQDGAGRISVDLPNVLLDPAHRDNIAMAMGDSIHIPRYVPTVRVEGAVLSPASVTFVPNAKTSYYVDAAGGFTRLADKGRTFVQQANGLIQPKGNRPEPGAIVVVPEKDPDQQRTNVPVLIAAIAQALTALTTVVILLERVFRSP